MKVEERLLELTEIVPGARVKRRRRRKVRNRFVSTLLIVSVVGGAGLAGVKYLNPSLQHGSEITGLLPGQQTYLWMMRRSDDLSRRSDMLALFALDQKARHPVILLIPAQAQTEVPGHGLDSIGRAFSFGGMPLQALAVDNMLGIRLDFDIASSDLVMGKMVDQAGGLDIDVASTLLQNDPSGSQTAVFEQGHQHFDGAKVRAYLEYQGSDETELSRLARAQQVWDALITSWRRLGPAVLASRFADIGREFGTGLETGASDRELATFFSAMAKTGTDARVFATVPVTPVGAGGSEQALKVDEAGVEALVLQHFTGSLPPKRPRAGRIEILNGNGTPQIGEKVSLKLIPAGFRLIIDRNARAFDFEHTKLVIYSRDDESYAAARRIHDLLGVGTIEVGLRTQTVVDVTIVVGKDFGG